MTHLKQWQEEIFQNKQSHGFNKTNIEKEFLLLYREVAEAFDAYKKNENIGEELAVVAIYLLGLAEILHIDLGEEIQEKIKINQERKYQSTENGYAKRFDEVREKNEKD